jgi:hypothetical protein
MRLYAAPLCTMCQILGSSIIRDFRRSEYWLAHPVDRVLTIYRLQGSTYDRPPVTELVGTTPIDVLPGVTLTRAPIVERLLPAD